MFKVSKFIICAAGLLFVRTVEGQERAVAAPVLAPQTLTRVPGGPVTLQVKFDLKPLIHGPYTLEIGSDRVHKTRVDLNGTALVNSWDESKTFETRTVTLQPSNTLDVELEFRDGAFVTVAVFGYQYENASDYTGIAFSPVAVRSNAVIDWRSKGAVTPVQNQGEKNEADWAFSAAGALEGAWAEAGKGLQNLSEQQLLDCVAYTKRDPAGALRLEIARGAISGNIYTYTGIYGTCKGLTTIVQPKGLKRAPIGDEDSLAALVQTSGPVSVVLDGNWLAGYTSGIADPDCEARTPVFKAVLIVGVGVDSTTGTRFWLMKNSVGYLWGESGYFRMVRGKNKCGIADYAIIPTV